jgi:hemerythrin
MSIYKIEVAPGIHWIKVSGVGLRILCGCPTDAVKHLIKRGLIVPQEINGTICETGPNAILLSDVPVQNGEFSNLAEFPVLQMLYRQGLMLPNHPNNTGRKPMLIGSADQVESQMRYIYRGNYGLVSSEEIIQAGVSPEQANEMMRLKLRFAFGRIRPSSDFIETRIVGGGPVEIASGVFVRRLRPNVFEFSHGSHTATVDLNLAPGTTYESAHPIGFRHFKSEYFSVIHSGEGDGWAVDKSVMSSIITFQGNTYLIDAGPQLLKTLKALGIGIDQVDGIFHTHAHDDHFAGLTALMRAGKRIRYFSTALVRSSVQKKLAALIGLEEKHFSDFFDVHDLRFDEWNNVQGLEVMPIFSPHPVETNVFVFRALWGEGYRTYAHFADIVSLNVLKGMITDRPDMPGIDQTLFNRTEAAYLAPYDVKKLDVGGGLIHGDARDFSKDKSARILLAHRATSLTPEEKEIGSSAAFGTTDVLIEGQSDALRRHAFQYMQANLPGLAFPDLRLLVNHPITEINPGAIYFKEGDEPREVTLILSGEIERMRTRDKMFSSLSAGNLIGDDAVLENRAVAHTYRASSFAIVMRIPAVLYANVVRRNGLMPRLLRLAVLRSFLDTTALFCEGVPVSVLGRIADEGVEKEFEAGESLTGADLQKINIIRAGRMERHMAGKVLEVMTPGAFFGEESAVLDVPALTQVRSIEKSRVLQVDGEVLRNVPLLRWKILETFQQRASRTASAYEEENGLIQWQDEISIRVAQFDSHHRKLVGIANAIALHLERGSERSALCDALDALVAYTCHHFTAEEQLMTLYGFPDAASHCKQHEELAQQILDYRDHVMNGEIPDKAGFLKFVEHWLVRHIEDEDRRYGEFLNSKGVY